MTLNTTVTATVVSEDLGIDIEDIAIASTQEASNSHQSSVRLDASLIAPAMSDRKAAIELISELNRLKIVASNMQQGDHAHPHSFALSAIYRDLANQASYNISQPTKADWTEFADHQVKSGYMGHLSKLDLANVMLDGGFGILSQNVEGMGRLYANRIGWSLAVDGQNIDVPATVLRRLLLSASKETVQSAPWDRKGAMFHSSNFDGMTVVVRPKGDKQFVSVISALGEEFQFPILRISCSHWDYVALARWTVAALFPQFLGNKEYAQYQILAAKHFGDGTHVPANKCELEYVRYLVTMANQTKKNFFKTPLLQAYAPADLATIETFRPAYDRVVSARVATANERKASKAAAVEEVVTDEVILDELLEDGDL